MGILQLFSNKKKEKSNSSDIINHQSNGNNSNIKKDNQNKRSNKKSNKRLYKRNKVKKNDISDLKDSLDNKNIAKDYISEELEQKGLEPIETKKVNLDSKEERTIFLQENCEQIIEASKQVEEARIEYHLVTSYLSDIQKIDRIPLEERADLDDAARQIIALTNERTKYQKSTTKITNKQFKNFEKYENEIPSELKKMKENEAYQLVIKNDMMHLEGEKGSLKYQKEENIAKQKYLKGLAIITCVLVTALFLLFIAIANVFEVNVQIPFLLTIIMAAVSAFYIFYEARKNTYEMKLIELKQKKAIGFINKVKIKYVNNTSLLEYSYQKYNVKSFQEFKYLWEQYVKAKDDENRYKKNTDLLNFYNEILIKELKKYQVADPDIWVYQALAIIDPKEMVEIRHSLNVRRQKLRDRIDYNTQIKNTCLNEIKNVIGKKDSLREEIVEILAKYQINI